MLYKQDLACKQLQLLISLMLLKSVITVFCRVWLEFPDRLG